MMDLTDIDGRWPGETEDGRALADAYARIDEAISDMQLLEDEVEKFVRQTVGKMAKGWAAERNSFVVTLPPTRLAHAGRANNRIRLLCGKVSENLRAALDYGIVRVSLQDNASIVERDVQFILAKDSTSYGNQAKRALKYVAEDIKSWVERLQPYHGNEMLAFIRDTSNIAKHRSLIKLKLAPRLTIVLRENPNQSKHLDEGDWWVFPAGKGHAFFVRAERSQLIVRKRFDAFTVLPMCIEHVQTILNTLEYRLRTGHFPPETNGSQG